MRFDDFGVDMQPQPEPIGGTAERDRLAALLRDACGEVGGIDPEYPDGWDDFASEVADRLIAAGVGFDLDVERLARALVNAKTDIYAPPDVMAAAIAAAYRRDE